MSEKYHVYILGAGASAHVGLPVLSDFFDEAEKLNNIKEPYSISNGSIKLINQPPINGYGLAIHTIRDFRKESVNQCDTSNIEDVYRLATEQNNSTALKALEKIIEGVLDLRGCLVKLDPSKYYADSVYTDFIKKNFSKKENIVVISFNWDCLLDYALFRGGFRPYYGISPYSDDRYYPKLFKLHGSINWGWCRNEKCKSNIIVEDPRKLADQEMRDIEETDLHDLRIISKGWGRRHCEQCGNFLSPKIVPPTYKKNLTEEIEKIWKESKELLYKANKITIIGYSFPNTDKDFLDLIDCALEKTIDLRCIEVINRSNNDSDFKERYKTQFKKHKNKIKFFSDVLTFEDYIYRL